MERIVQFGPEGRLVGILSGGVQCDNALTLVLPSAGLIPRSGPFRLHVELARRLEEQGIRTFRFEVPGVGETPRLPGWDRASPPRPRSIIWPAGTAAGVSWSAASAVRRIPVGRRQCTTTAYAACSCWTG